MSRGYKKLVADEFFGDVNNIDWDKVKLIDKINLEAKVGNLVDVPFNAEEQNLYHKTMTTEEFSEVLDVVREILAYTKDNQQDLMTPPQMPKPDVDDNEKENNEDPTSMGHDDMENDYEQEENTKDEQSSSNNEVDKDTETTEEESNSSTNPQPEHTDEDVSVTDEIFRAMEESLIPETSDTLYGNNINKEKINKAVILHKDLMDKRNEKMNRMTEIYKDDDYYGTNYRNCLLYTSDAADE